MTGTEYYRQQAQNCLRLAMGMNDKATTARLIEMAEDYLAKAQAAEGGAKPSPEMSGTGKRDE
jgi:hypothetical protein